tara:strand:- start:463 stop:1494 length:1032 start_codon:yes stop_codon:yes gene_type:complete
MADKSIQRLYRYIYGNWSTMITRTYAELGIAELLAESPRSPEEIAEDTQSDPEALNLLLQCAEELGFHRKDPESSKLILREIGTLLNPHHPNSLHAAAILNGEDYRYGPWGRLPEFVRSGDGREISPTWDTGSLPYLASRPSQLATFQKAMQDLSTATLSSENENRCIASSIPLDQFSKIIDVGGGTGSLLSAIRERNAQCALTLFDLPSVLAESTLAEESRISLREGDFFEEIPPGYGAYLFKNVLHNHPKERLHKIFRNLAIALKKSPSTSRAFFFELIHGSSPRDPSRNSLIDMNLFLLVGGRVRSHEEYNELLSPHGLQIVSNHPLQSSARRALEIQLL